MCNAYGHPPGCRCGWGGEGHAGRSYNGGGFGKTGRQSFPSVSLSWAKKDETWKTCCPECKEPVFFIRHNGGSLWVDQLGWPWEKHSPCFDQTTDPVSPIRNWDENATNLNKPKICLITEFKHDDSRPLPVLTIRSGDSCVWTVVIDRVVSGSVMVGSIAIVSLLDRKLLHPLLGMFSLASIKLSEAPSGKHVECPLCGKKIRTVRLEPHQKACRVEMSRKSHK